MSTKRRLPSAPRHLSVAAKKWWREVVGEYEIENHHLKVLRAACEAWDRLNQARVLLKTEGITYLDRFGSPKKHPAVSIEETARLQFVRLLRELDLEGEPHPGYRRN